MNDCYNIYSIVIELGATQNGFSTKILGRALHSQVLEWFHIADENLAESLHEAQISPFTISPLIPKHRRKTAKLGDRFFFRVGLLRGDLLQPLLKGIDKQSNQKITLDKFYFRICQTYILSGSHTFADTTNYFLLSQTKTLSKITINFETCTSFKIEKGIIQPFPLGENVFNSLLRRWNYFSPEELHFPEISWLIPVASFNLKTTAIHLKKFELGCQGWVTYLFPNSEQSKIASVLAEYAFFAGVGRKTAMGMGQVKIRDKNNG